MPKTVGLVVGWLVAGIGAVTLATMAVGAVGDQLTDDRPAPLSAAEVRSELDEAAVTTTTPAAPGATSTTSSTATDDRGGALRGASRGPDDRGGDVVTTTVPTSPTVPSGSPAATTQTFNLVGGTATLRFSPAGAQVVTATPRAGYRVDIEPDHGNGVRVEFESDSHRSRVSGWWDGGPRSETREEATSGGGGDGGSTDGSGSSPG